MSHDQDLTPEEQELFEALKRGAVVFVNTTTGETEIRAHDDLPPDMRECIRINRATKRIPCVGGVYQKTSESEAIWNARAEHRAECPSCLETDAYSTLMDATWWREEADHDPAPYPDGTRRTPEQAAVELEAEAGELRLRAAKIREGRS